MEQLLIMLAGNVQPQDDGMYGQGDFPSYRVVKNCYLVKGWAKFTNAINGGNIPHIKTVPVLTMFDVTTITSTCVGIEDCLNPIPHSYIFLPKKLGHIVSQSKMVSLMSDEGEEILQNYDTVNNDMEEEDILESNFAEISKQTLLNVLH